MERGLQANNANSAGIEQQIESEPIVCEAGRIPTELVIIRSGFGRLSQQHGASHRTTAYLERDMSLDWKRLAYNSVRPSQHTATEFTEHAASCRISDALFIPAETFAARHPATCTAQRSYLTKGSRACCFNQPNSVSSRKEPIGDRTHVKQTPSGALTRTHEVRPEPTVPSNWHCWNSLFRAV